MWWFQYGLPGPGACQEGIAYLERGRVPGGSYDLVAEVVQEGRYAVPDDVNRSNDVRRARRPSGYHAALRLRPEAHVIRTIDAILDRLDHLYSAYFGNKKLLPMEALCLAAWRETLSEGAKEVLAAQLASVDLIQRSPGGAKACYYWIRRPPPVTFSNASGVQWVATVRLKGSGDHAMPVKVYVVDGHLFSFEFPKRPARYLALHGMDQAPLRVAGVTTRVVLEGAPATG